MTRFRLGNLLKVRDLRKAPSGHVKKSLKLALFISLFSPSPSALHADDGIWLLNEFPRSAVRARYKVDVTDDFLRKLQIGSVRFNNGGSGSFVSPDGLVITNHHVGADCIQKLSRPDANYMADGFLAKTRPEEARCPDLELNVLLKIENVTEKVKGAAPAGTAPAEASVRYRSAMNAIEKECADRTSHRCDVVTLFSGGQYHLYEYQKYTDIRLVFAPERDIAFFGGDPDNFTYPRYDLDIAFFRVYEKEAPIRPMHYFPFSRQGARNGELTFVSGNPGSTGRLLTVAEMELQRDVTLPFTLRRLQNLIEALKRFAATSPEAARVSIEEIMGNENSFKAYSGFLSGLKDPAFMDLKRRQQSDLQRAVNSDADRKARYGSVWDELASIAGVYRGIYPRLIALENGLPNYGSILPIARQVLRLAVERQKPNAERLREYSEAAVTSLEESLYTPAPLSKELEQVTLTECLKFLSETLGSTDPLVVKVLRGQSPAERAAAIIAGTRLFDIEERKRLAATSATALESTDPLLELVRDLDAAARQVRKQYEDQVLSRQSIETARVAQAQYAVGGDVYPDATFTLRVSFGPAKGYRDASGKSIPWTTDFAGLYKRQTGKDPYKLPQRWLDRKQHLKLGTPYNFVTTADTHGGNSGSPTVNPKGEFVGILFDGNLEGLPNRYVYTETRARSVHVAVQGIVAALRSIYSADALLKELGH